MENGSYSAANEDVEKLQDVIRQLELQNAKLRQRIPAGKSPKVEKHDVGELIKNLKTIGMMFRKLTLVLTDFSILIVCQSIRKSKLNLTDKLFAKVLTLNKKNFLSDF